MRRPIELTQAFAPPFDFVSNFRDPGKINVNTITDERVWNALMSQDPANAIQYVTFAEWTDAMPFRIEPAMPENWCLPASLSQESSRRGPVSCAASGQ